LVGGGYALGDAKTFFPVLLDLYEKLEDTSCPTSIFFLEYSLSDQAKYPTQLREAAEAYRYLVDELNISPSRVTIGGDSAGGNLTLQLVRHIVDPHPDISITFATSYKPAKCILVSPWLSMDHSSGGYTRNKDNDIMVREWLERYAFKWKGNHSDIFTDPLKAASWVNVLPSTMIVSGDQELFVDDIMEFCEKLKKVHDVLRISFDHRVGVSLLRITGKVNCMTGGG
jgi:acetyl esterase/lipase